MNLEKILTQYDAMFGQNSLKEIEDYLVNTMKEAEAKGENGILVTLLNEVIGFFRDTTQKEKALAYCEQLQRVLSEMNLEGRIDYATSLLNVANAYRAFGLFEKSLHLYKIVEDTYRKQLSAKDFMHASLYNNWSLLYQEMGDYVSAKEMLLKALEIADFYEEAVIPQATTRTNLAATLLQMGTEEAYQEAVSYLQEALSVFEKDGGKDFHYGAALVAMGDACRYQKELKKAAEYYEKGLQEIEKHVGRTDNYARVLEKYEYVKGQIPPDTKKVWTSNLERCKTFYDTHGKKMIHEKFSEFENQIAVGLVGEGSDCFGFDDGISMDHDYGIGFCMWLADAVYKQIGESLQAEYEGLIFTYADSASKDIFLKKRRGVFSINHFFNQLLGTTYDFENRFVDCGLEDLLESGVSINEYQLAAAVNGIVFEDGEGIFSKIRERLSDYYPQKFWCKKLAQGLHDFSQYAQSNYPRMMARRDLVTAGICRQKGMEVAMDLIYLLGKTYAPYYKWKKKGLEQMTFPLAKEILPLLEELAALPSQEKAWEEWEYSPVQINTYDRGVVLFEQIAERIINELVNQKLIKKQDSFLEGYINQIIRGKNMDIVEKIIELEWKQFDKVQNEGGRAGCQDDYETFCIMRKSQYLTWPELLQESFYKDLVFAQEKGWNLIMEKYARMMESTAPEKYKEMANELPVLNEERVVIQEEIIKIQINWMEEFASQYPKMAGNARRIYTEEDTPFSTSYETYLRGELGTYSEITFILYGKFITDLLKENRNLAYEIMENTAKLYGYETIEAAEQALA